MHREILAEHRAPSAALSRLNEPVHAGAEPVPPVLRVLLVEDNPGDARLIQEMLREAGMAGFELIHMTALTPAIEYIREYSIDVLLLDLTLPESAGLNTVYRILEHAADVPVIVLTGGNDGELAINAVKAGVQDYLIKDDTDSDWLLRCIRYAIERKRGEQCLARKNEQLEESNQNLRQLAFAMTHDLQTPLASLVGAVDVLRSNLLGAAAPNHRDNDSNSTNEWLDRVDNAATRMTNMLDNLLEYAKAGNSTIEREALSLKKVVESAVKEHSGLAATRKITMTAKLDDATVSADEQSLYRIIANLLSNAVKFSPDGGTVELTTHIYERTVRLRIADHGKGIPPEKIPQLYLPFKRLDHSKPGTGLGLPISRRLAEAMDGKVWLESNGANGTQAYLELPLARNSSTSNERSTS